jgi:hypothetical protein
VYNDHKVATKKEVSRRRQLLHDAANRYAALVGDLIAEPGPLIQGSYLTHGTRCGKPNCKCNEGHLHNTAVLSVSDKGRRTSIYVRPPDRPEVQNRTERYRLFRLRRADLVKLHAEIIKTVDELLATLVEPYLPSRDRKRSQSKRRRSKSGRE